MSEEHDHASTPDQSGDPADATGAAGRLKRALFAPMDGASLAAFRILFGAILVWEVWRYFDRGWIKDYYIDPILHFKYFGFSWVHPWPGDWMYVHFIVVAVAAIFVALGLFYRIAAIVLFITFTHWFLLDTAIYLNHLYLVSLFTFLMIFVPANRTFSIDAWTRGSMRSDDVPAWSVWLIRGQLGLVYFYAGIAKFNEDWMRCEPIGKWLRNMSDRELLDGLVPIGRIFEHDPAIWFFAYGGMMFDLLVPFLLVWRRTRIFALAAAIAFHLMNAWMFSIGIFPWFGIAATLIFLRPDWPRLIFNLPRRIATADPRWSWNGSTLQKAVFGGLAVWFFIQCALPFRHLLYPGVVHWTEEGHRFAWHMKLRSKSGRSQFFVENPETNFREVIRLRDHLSPRQRRKLRTHPDMIVQFAHYLADLYREEHGDVRVRAQIRASLNGRPWQLLIDPAVDLSKVSPSLFSAASWIVPLEGEPGAEAADEDTEED